MNNVKVGDYFWVVTNKSYNAIVRVIYVHPAQPGVALLKIVQYDSRKITFARCHHEFKFPSSVCENMCTIEFAPPPERNIACIKVPDLGRKLTRLEIALYNLSEVGGSSVPRRGSHKGTASESSPSSL